MKKLALILAGLFLVGCTVIPPGHRGVRFYFGKASDDIMQPGTHVWFPYFFGVQEFNVQIIPVKTRTSAGSKDQQVITAEISANIQIDPTQVKKVLEIAGTDDAIVDRILPILAETVTTTVAQYKAEEILTMRQELKSKVEALALERFDDYGVTVKDISLDMDYSAEYSKAVEQKQVAEQRAKQAIYETTQAREEARAAIERAEGIAQANTKKLASLTPQLLQYEAIQKWDGKLPQFSGNSNMPFLLNITPKQ